MRSIPRKGAAVASNSGLTLVGVEFTMGNLRRLARGSQKEAARAMNEEGNAIKTASMKRTPVSRKGSIGPSGDRLRPGNLRASHRVETVTPGDNVITTVSVGKTAPYARFVHEILRNKHTVGEAKFLEKSFKERRPIAEKIAARIDLNRAGRG